jgi:hypothetical protein
MSVSIAALPMEARPAPTFLSPADMARRLVQAHAANAKCFALAMYERSAWANDHWAAYWAEIIDLV